MTDPALTDTLFLYKTEGWLWYLFLKAIQLIYSQSDSKGEDDAN